MILRRNVLSHTRESEASGLSLDAAYGNGCKATRGPESIADEAEGPYFFHLRRQAPSGQCPGWRKTLVQNRDPAERIQLWQSSN